MLPPVAQSQPNKCRRTAAAGAAGMSTAAVGAVRAWHIAGHSSTTVKRFPPDMLPKVCL
jgi:hypothetical protein